MSTPPPAPRLTFPYGRRNVLAAGEALTVFPSPSGPATAYASSDESILAVERSGATLQLLGRGAGVAQVLIDGAPIAEPIYVVDPAQPRRLFLHLRLGDSQARAEVVAGYDPSYPRDVTADPALRWETSNALILGLVPGTPGALVSHADGGATLTVSFHGLRAEVDVDCSGGVISWLGGLDADGRDFLIAGILTPLGIQVDRSSTRGLRDDSCVQLTAQPADAVRIERFDGQWHVAGLRPGVVTVEAVVGTLRRRQALEVRALPLEISDLSVEGSFQADGQTLVFSDESPELSARLSAPGYSYIPTRPNLCWSTSDAAVAHVDASGGSPRLQCTATGPVTIRVECRGVIAELPIVVTERPEIEWF